VGSSKYGNEPSGSGATDLVLGGSVTLREHRMRVLEKVLRRFNLWEVM
jgi:hypothetical protein